MQERPLGNGSDVTSHEGNTVHQCVVTMCGDTTSLVLVDSETRLPTPVPSEFGEGGGGLGNRKYQVEMVKRL